MDNEPQYYLVITPFFPSAESFRGPFVFDQVNAIRQAGEYIPVVLKPKPWYSKGTDYTFEGVRVYYFKTFDLPSNILPGLFQCFTVWSMMRKLKSIGLSPKDTRVVHAHVTGTGFLANALKKKHNGIKTLLQHHGFDVLSLANGRLHKFRWHQKWVQNYGIGVCNQIDLHVGVSAKTLEYLKRFPEINIKDSYVLYNGVDTAKFHPMPGLRNNDYFTIGCIGNFWELKDQLTLIKAAEKLVNEGMQNLRVIFIGSGAQLQSCRDYIGNRHLSKYVEFRSEVPHFELCRFYNTLDLFVLPSWYEAFGCVYSEAFVCGVPFLAVEDQGISELIPDEDKPRWLIKKGDSNRLADLILDFRNNRYVQRLNVKLEINSLIQAFLHKVGSMQVNKN
jgi:glycosyltransferase involved in cell wall biosynthesis